MQGQIELIKEVDLIYTIACTGGRERRALRRLRGLRWASEGENKAFFCPNQIRSSRAQKPTFDFKLECVQYMILSEKTVTFVLALLV